MTRFGVVLASLVASSGFLLFWSAGATAQDVKKMAPRPARAGGMPPVPGPMGPAAPGQPNPSQGRSGSTIYPETSNTANTLLRNAAGHVREGKWSEAIDLYQRVIQQFENRVEPVPKDDPAGDPQGDSHLFLDLRLYCQSRLGALPPEARALYRGRVDAQAERLFRQGEADRDRVALRKVVEQMFCSSWGDDALDLLSDMAFQDGRFAEALVGYRQLLPDRPDENGVLVHPDPSVDLARVAAKKLLCRAALGDEPPTPSDLKAYEAAYPEATGKLAGRTGPYARTLVDALAADHLAPPSQTDGRWPTFAGSPTRTKLVRGPVDVGSLQWSVRMTVPQSANNPAPTPPPNMPFNRRGGFIPPQQAVDPGLPFHPIVLNDQVVFADEKQIVAYNLSDRPTNGSASVSPSWKYENHSPQWASNRIFESAPRHTLTASGDRIFARMASSGSNFSARAMMGGGGGVPQNLSWLVAVQRSTDGKLLWRRPSSDVELPKRGGDNATNANFEGTPVADDRNVYVGLTVSGPMTAVYVACLDAETGATRWVKFLFEANAPAVENGMGGFGMQMPMPTDMGNRLLTLDGATVYFQTNLGAVAALEAETGALRWLATYPRKTRPNSYQGNARERDLNPAIVHEGLVIVAPEDAPGIYAFDSASGRMVWKIPLMEPHEVDHVLGVGKGRLIVTGNHVWTFDVKTGALLRSWPDGRRGFDGNGRGLLAGDSIYWPTKNEIHVLDLATGLRSDRPAIKLQEKFGTGGGNLAVGDGYLVVAQAENLVVFCQNSRLLERYRQDIAAAPEQAGNYFRLARVAEATGDDALALASLDSALAKARGGETLDGLPLAETARNHKYRLQMKLGAKALAESDWEGAARRFDSAGNAASLDRDRLNARLLLADTQAEHGDPRQAVRTLQGLLADDRLRPLTVDVDKNRTVRADLAIADRLSTLLREKGRGAYEEFDRRTLELLERGNKEKDPRQLEEVGRSYPVAAVLPDSLLALGRLRESLGLPAEAAHAYKRLLANANDDQSRARALLGLARCYEAQRLWFTARDAYAQVQARFPDVMLEELGTDASAGSAAARRLTLEPFDRIIGETSQPNLPVPLSRSWSRKLKADARPLAAEGVSPSLGVGRFFLVEGTSLSPVDPSSGDSSWKTDLGGEPIWIGYLADRLIAATQSKLFALNPAKGTIDWQYNLLDASPDDRGPNPTKPENKAKPPDPAPRFHGFQIVGGRIFCRKADRELLAFDGDAGLVDWSYSPAAGTLGSRVSIGQRRIVLQVRKPNSTLVLETETGRRRAEFSRPEEEPEWARDPLPIDDDRVALVPDANTVSLLDLNRGTASWTFRESGESTQPSNGPPRLIGDAERLVVLHNGNRLIRLDPKSGVKLWSSPLGAEDLSARPEALRLEGDRFYWISGRALGALSLSDGKVVWRRFLNGPTRGWEIALTLRCVAAYPSFSQPADGDQAGLPLVFCRRDTGDLAQRLLFPTGEGGLDVRFAPGGVLLANAGGLWALADRKPSDKPKTGR